MDRLIKKGRAAKLAASVMNTISKPKKDEALKEIAEMLKKNAAYIIEENKKDIEGAKAKGIPTAMLDRLMLNEDRIEDIVGGVMQVLDLEDPIGRVEAMWERPNGLRIGTKRVPLGVVGIIYEARPNVTADAAVLCLKTSNAVILKGGSEAINSNTALVSVMRAALANVGLPEDAVQIIEDTDRETTAAFMKLNEYVDVLIPRGGAGLIKAVLENATIPVIETGSGNCHVYVDESADESMALDIIINAKTQRPSVCNACESLVIHEGIAEKIIPQLIEGLTEKNVEVRGCERTRELSGAVRPADLADYAAEYNDLIISIKVVKSIDDAIAHINRYSTRHSEAIVTRDYFSAEKFLNEIDSACVYVNASTRFTDGYEFGFGAEIGISTQKLHARGPMGLKELTSVKYVVYGNGQVR